MLKHDQLKLKHDQLAAVSGYSMSRTACKECSMLQPLHYVMLTVMLKEATLLKQGALSRKTADDDVLPPTRIQDTWHAYVMKRELSWERRNSPICC
jgi:hypothetical protein